MSGFIGFIGGFINFIKGLFSGIFGIFGKKSGGSSGYFLEMEDAKGTGSAPAAAPKAAPAKQAEPAPEAAAKAVATPAPAKAEAPQPAPAAVAKALNLPAPTVTNFATDYLLPASSNSRRRPGANMSSFLDMARQTKTARG